MVLTGAAFYHKVTWKGLVGMQQCGVFYISAPQGCENEFEKEIAHYISTSNTI